MDNLSRNFLDEVFSAVGEHLEAAGKDAAIVVVGGSALAARGWVDRVTKDVDVIALATREDRRVLLPSQPLPEHLVDAASQVARDYNLPKDWLNADIGAQWSQGLPDGLADGLEWRRYRSLDVGFAGRAALIALKLFATVDQSPESVHGQDLIRLRPTDHELEQAARWVRQMDAGEAFPTLLAETLEHVRSAVAENDRERR